MLRIQFRTQLLRLGWIHTPDQLRGTTLYIRRENADSRGGATGIHRNSYVSRISGAVGGTHWKDNVSSVIGHPYCSRNCENAAAACNRKCLTWTQDNGACTSFHVRTIRVARSKNETHHAVFRWVQRRRFQVFRSRSYRLRGRRPCQWT